MNQDPITCGRVDEEDLDVRYLAGTLDEGLAEAFEVHYFQCDRCWRLVQRGAEVRAGGRPRRRIAPRWLGLAAAAALAGAVGIGLWRRAPAPEAPIDLGVVRGPGDSLVVRPSIGDRGLEVRWTSIGAAVAYRVRLFTRDGDVVVERETADTAALVAWDSLPAARADSLYWQVQPLDRLREPLGRSPLVATPARRQER